MVNSTLDFEASSDQDWLTITPGEDFITLTAADNSGETGKNSECHINIYGINFYYKCYSTADNLFRLLGKLDTDRK